MNCQLCLREVEKLTLHHLIPKSEDGRYSEKVEICSPCHRQIHVLYDHKRLARELNTLDKLRSEPKMQKFLNWVRKQKPNKRIKVRS